ncbi:zf-TFIIB domain-containing protein [Salipiger sp. PrR007]
MVNMRAGQVRLDKCPQCGGTLTK